MNLCCICRMFLEAGGVCRNCTEQLLVSASDHFRDGQITALYEYSGAIRELVIRAKVKNDFFALKGLAKLFCINPKTLTEVGHVDLLTSAPSSLWGRVRGRYDLAEALALELESESGKPLISLPIWSYLRWSKRANRNLEFTNFNEIKHRPSFLFKDRKVLLIDDILTTGKTIMSIKDILFRLGAAEVNVLLLSSAAGPNSKA